ncbi:MAG: thioesterase family protein, partial [Acidimicrobiia bacterium]|nr:thioesterase family protein [Acidimicrobiia bacterium]
MYAQTGDAERPVYTRDGDFFVPSILAQGPWNPDAQHGGPVAALLAWLMEQVPSAAPMQFVRVTVDLMREVPIAPLTVSTRVVRAGRRIAVLEAALIHNGREVARASGLRMRLNDVPLEYNAAYHRDEFDTPPGDVDPAAPEFERPPGAHVAGILRVTEIDRVTIVNRHSANAQMW